MSEEINESVEQVASEAPVDSGNWMDSISEELRSDPSMANIQDLEGLAKGYVHAQRMVGSDKVVMPGKDASQEELDMFYNKLGRPETGEGYEAPTENMPEIPYDKELEKQFFGEAHRIGLNKQQAAALLRWQAQSVEQQIQAQDAGYQSRMQDTEAQLRNEFGNAFDQNLEMAQNVAKEFGGDELMKVLNDTGMGNDPVVIKAFYNIAKVISNDEIIGGGGRQTFALSPADAKHAISEKKRDPNFMKSYTDRDAIGHAEAVAEMGRLYESAYPEVDG